MQVQKVEISSIIVDEKIQQRASLNEEYIVELSKEIADGAVLPPLDVYDINGDLLLTDGFHRLMALIKASAATTVEVNVYKGTERDAVLHAVGANTKHGLRRTNADKRFAVTTLLEDKEWKNWSDGQIARICRVSQPFVSKVRNERTQNGFESDSMRKGADGRLLDTSNIGAQRKTEEPEESSTAEASWSHPSLAEMISTDENEELHSSEENDDDSSPDSGSGDEPGADDESSDQTEEGDSESDGNDVDDADESTPAEGDEEEPIPDSSPEEQATQEEDEEPETDSGDDPSPEEATDAAGEDNSPVDSEADDSQATSVGMPQTDEVQTLKAKIADLESVIAEKDQRIEELEAEKAELQSGIQELEEQLIASNDSVESAEEVASSPIF